MRKGMDEKWFQFQLPFLPTGFLFSLRIKKEVMVLYSKLFKSSTGCLSINALTEEISANRHHLPISFTTCIWDCSWSERKKNLSKYSESQASIQTVPFKDVASFLYSKRLFSFGRNDFGSRKCYWILIPPLSEWERFSPMATTEPSGPGVLWDNCQSCPVKISPVQDSYSTHSSLPPSLPSSMDTCASCPVAYNIRKIKYIST